MSSYRLRHWTIGGAFGLLLTIIIASSSQAASIVSSNPSDGAVVHVAPTQVTITADGALVEMGTSLVVSGEDGVRVDDGSVQINGSTALVGVQPLRKAGRYTVTYQLIFGDGQNLNGSYNFTLSGSNPEKPSPTPTTIGTLPPVAHSMFFENLKRGGMGLLLAMLILLVIGSRVARSRRNRG